MSFYLQPVHVNRGRSRTLAIGLIVILLLVVMLPSAYAFLAFDAIKKLRIQSATIEVERDGWSIYVTILVIIENPTSIPIPALSILRECKLNENVLFYGEMSTIDSLNPYSTATLEFSTLVNFDLLGDLFWTLVDYLSGKPITYLFQFKITMHLVFDFRVTEIKYEGLWELY